MTLDIQNASIGDEDLTLTGTLKPPLVIVSIQELSLAGGAAVLSADAGASLTLDGTTGVGGAGLILGNRAPTKNGAGTVIIDAITTGTGTITVTAGTLAIENANGLGAIGATTVQDGGTLDLRNVTLLLMSQ